MFDLCAGFVYSQVLLACVQLDVFAILHREGSVPLPRLAPLLGLPAQRAACLLDAAVALRLLQRRRDVYCLGPLGAAMIGNPGISAMIRHHAAFYTDIADPAALLRDETGDTALSRYWAYATAAQPAELAGDEVGDYSALMAASQPMIAAEALDAYPLRRHRCLLDLGGGEGAFLEQVARRWPHLQLMLFDLPAVADRGRKRLGERATCFGGDFRHDPLPTGADIISLVRVLHDHDDAPALAILRRAREALPQDGRVLVVEPMADTAHSIANAYFGFYLLAMGSGRPRSPAALSALLLQAGFRAPRVLRTRQPMLAGALLAEV